VLVVDLLMTQSRWQRLRGAKCFLRAFSGPVGVHNSVRVPPVSGRTHTVDDGQISWPDWC
jgi:hypothetical protein